MRKAKGRGLQVRAVAPMLLNLGEGMRDACACQWDRCRTVAYGARARRAYGQAARLIRLGCANLDEITQLGYPRLHSMRTCHASPSVSYSGQVVSVHEGLAK